MVGSELRRLTELGFDRTSVCGHTDGSNLRFVSPAFTDVSSSEGVVCISVNNGLCNMHKTNNYH
jgi:hypothetical protein